jgi:electron transport complex protein RnfC
VAGGERATARVVTVAGPRVASPGNLLVPFGADAGEVLEIAEVRGDEPAIHGPAMTGQTLPPGAVVTAQTNALLALEPPPAGVPTPCIRCGWCTDNCPARLNVAALNDDFELGRPERAGRRGALACVGCGICSYVCPARLPLARRVGLLVQAIGEAEPAAAAGASE